MKWVAKNKRCRSWPCLWGIAGVVLCLSGDLDAQRVQNRGRERPSDALESLRNTIYATVAPDSWDEVGGEGSISLLRPHNLLVISQTEPVHGEINDLLQAIQRAITKEDHPGKGVRIFVAERTQQDKLRDRLAEVTSVEWVDQPLQEVLDFLGERYGFNVKADVLALDEVGITVSAPVSFEVRDIPLASALRLMLRPLGLTYSIEENVVLITTPEVAESRTRVKVYDVRCLLVEAEPTPDGAGD